MTGLSVIQALKRKFKVSTDVDLAAKLGITTTAVQSWKRRKKALTPGNVARLAHFASRAGARNLQATAIRPLVEFFPITRSTARKATVNYQVFSPLENGVAHPYRQGLKEEMIAHHGVYVFFDSRGQAIYVGKARKQSLWKEINHAFNRERGGVQKIRRVNHPNRKIEYRNSDEKSRQILEREVSLHELAAYFSAYHVNDTMIDDLEALLVRSFANDILNIRMEQFSRQRRKTRS